MGGFFVENEELNMGRLLNDERGEVRRSALQSFAEDGMYAVVGDEEQDDGIYEDEDS